MIRKYTPLTMNEVRESHGREGKQAKSAEAKLLLTHLPKGAWAVALDERGARMSSASFAAWLGAKREAGVRDLRFVIGGPWGLDPQVARQCNESIRLSDMTLPYSLARVVFLEQYYRAVTIALGMPYHND